LKNKHGFISWLYFCSKSFLSVPFSMWKFHNERAELFIWWFQQHRSRERSWLLTCHDNLIMPSINPPALECRTVNRSTPSKSSNVITSSSPTKQRLHMLLTILKRRLEVIQLLIQIGQFGFEIRRLLDLACGDVFGGCEDKPGGERRGN
jgi:hypothetical protein